MNSIELLNIPMEKAEYTVLDFETTGTSAAHNRVIEVGLVKIKNAKVVDTYQSFVDPECLIPFHITQITSITNLDIVGAPTFYEIIDDINEFIGNSILVAHNMQFDFSFLKHEYQRAEAELITNKTLCTLKLARKIYADLPSKSLGNLTKSLRIQHKNVHRALGDASVTAKVLIKMFKRARDEFEIENVKDLITFQSMPMNKKNFTLIKKSMAEDITELPDKPGVYFFKNAKGNIVYIGKAKSIKKRLQNYFGSNAARKPKKIVQAASRIEFKKTNSELSALITEAELIKVHKPKFNSLLKKYSQAYFIKIDNEMEYARPKVTSKFEFDDNDYFGPYANRETASTLVEIVNKTFKLRECTEKDFKKKKSCYLSDIERCTAPCCIEDQSEYTEEMDKVYEFLRGQNQFAVNRLLDKMKTLSEEQKFEEAALIRDTIQNILNQLKRASILAEPINKANAFIQIRSSFGREYILMLQGKVFIKDDLTDEKNLFNSAIDDYFSGTINIFDKLEERDLERTKITLSWLVKNRTQAQLYYLSEYSSKEELYLNIKGM
ncbi:MAG: GIY-YIG nuclease family protein [Melioribacteraceae bacterium]|nr:GIY-YIG nuclease family protein [Melioribacteraceae bacterium]